MTASHLHHNPPLQAGESGSDKDGWYCAPCHLRDFEQMTSKKTVGRCHDCGCAEGELHVLGCDMEICPFCFGQLITCDCVFAALKLVDKKKYTTRTDYLPPEVYKKGLTEKQIDKWLNILESVSRIRYIRYPNMCVYCGGLWPKMYRVDDKDWEHYISPDRQGDEICEPCFKKIKKAIDAAEAKGR